MNLSLLRWIMWQKLSTLTKSSAVNCSTYIFGELSGGYSQYPEDSSSNLFKSIYYKCNAPSQLVIHRDENMMYYVYIRKIDAKRYIGLAIAINGYYFSQINSLFSLFEKQIEQLAEHGIIINYSKAGDLATTLPSLMKEEEEVMGYANYLQCEILSIKTVKKLPQSDYTISIKSQKIFNENDDNKDVVKASYTYGYTIILKQENYDTLRSTSYRNTLKQLNAQNEFLTKELSEKKTEISKLKAKQRNTTWVGVLGFIVIIFGVILWNRVLFPSEVTRYETGEFVYYGPMKDKKPHGVGVAVYPWNDLYERKYYIGNFVDGKRQDSSAMLLYKDGDYFYGNMTDDRWKHGLFYRRSDGTYFEGTFDDENRPYNGAWFDHVKKYDVVEGNPVYDIK